MKLRLPVTATVAEGKVPADCKNFKVGCSRSSSMTVGDRWWHLSLVAFCFEEELGFQGVAVSQTWQVDLDSGRIEAPEVTTSLVTKQSHP